MLKIGASLEIDSGVTLFLFGCLRTMKSKYVLVQLRSLSSFQVLVISLIFTEKVLTTLQSLQSKVRES